MSASRTEYTPLVWVNESTELSAENLNHIEQGISLNNALAIENALFIDEIYTALIEQLGIAYSEENNTLTLTIGSTIGENPTTRFNKTISVRIGLDSKLNKSNTSNTIYGKDAQGNEANIYYSSDYNNKSWQVVIRDANSDVLVPTTPSTDNAAASKAYVDNTKLDKTGGTLSGALNLDNLIYSNYGEFRFNGHLYFTDNTNDHHHILEIFENDILAWKILTCKAALNVDGLIWAGGKEIRFPDYVEFTDNTNDHHVIVKITPDYVDFNKVATFKQGLNIDVQPTEAQHAVRKDYVDTKLSTKADLVNGIIPASQLPAYVDDVVEFAKQVSGASWMNSVLETDPGTRVWNNATAANMSGGTSSPYYKKFLVNTNGTEAGLIIEDPMDGKIYVGKTDTNTYRWSGSNLVEISKSVGLGETASTAYAGNKGKANAQAIEALQTGKSNATNLENGSGTDSIQQKQDGTSGVFSFTDKNPHATNIDSSLTGDITYGGTGNFATVFGGKAAAMGKRSLAQGTTTIAKGKYSHAEGDNSVAYGDDSHAEGFATLSAGVASHTEGSKTQVLTTLPESGGGDDTPVDPPSGFLPDEHRGEASHAEGSLTAVYGFSSHAEGANTIVKGHYAHAEGVSTMAVGAGSKSYGNHSTANGDYSVAGGSYTTANQIGSFAHGYGASTYAEYSMAFGDNTQTVRRAQFAIGSYNVGKTTTLFEVGNGSSGSPSNAFEVYEDGHATVGGKTIATTDQIQTNFENGTGTNAVREKMAGATVNFTGRNSNAEALDSSLTATINTGASGNQSAAFGKDTMALATASFTNGNKTVAKGEESHAEGYQSVTLGDGSHAEGSRTTAYGAQSHSEGIETIAYGNNSHAEGEGTQARGINSHSEGYYNQALGNASHSEGSYTVANANGSHAEGVSNYIGAQQSGNPTNGTDVQSTQPSEYIPSYGEGSHAEGYDNFVYGHGSHAEGAQNVVSGNFAHASGVHNTAGHDYQAVIGKYNDNKLDTLFEVGNGSSGSPSNAFEVCSDGTLRIPNFNSSGTKIGYKKIKCINGVLTIID